jgi:hypothetical protein
MPADGYDLRSCCRTPLTLPAITDDGGVGPPPARGRRQVRRYFARSGIIHWKSVSVTPLRQALPGVSVCSGFGQSGFW